MTREAPLETRPAHGAQSPGDGTAAVGGSGVIWLLLVSAFVVILNETIMNVALPSIMDDLGVQPSTGQWLTTAFLLTLAVVIPITGYLLQRFPLRNVFIAAMTLFSVGTLLCAVAPGFELLVAGRVVQASGTGIMMPLLMTTVLTVVPAAARGRMMGNIAIVISVAPAVGPTVSGLILSVLPWRAIFWIVLPIALVALALGAARVRNVTDTSRVPIDVASVVLSALAFSGIVYGLSSFGEAAQGGTLLPPWIPLAIGAVALAAFVGRQLRLQGRDRALLDLRTFRSRTFTVTTVMFGVSMASLFGVIILLPIYTQEVLGFDVLASGLLLLPGGLLMGLSGPVVGRLYDRVGPRPLVVPGAVLLSAALWGLALADQSTPWPLVLGAHILLSLGLGLLFTPLFTAGLGSVRPRLYSHASATVNTLQQLAGAAGTALFVTIYTTQSVAATRVGADEIAAEAAGVQGAFIAGAIISLVGIVASLFVSRPADQPEGAPHPVH